MKVDGINQDALNSFGGNDYLALCKGGMAASDVVTQGHQLLNDELEAHLTVSGGEKIYFDTSDEDAYVEQYNKLYTTIAN